MEATVDCVRRRAAGRGEELERSLPSGETRRRVGSWGDVFWERNVVRGLVRSIVWDIVLEWVERAPVKSWHRTEKGWQANAIAVFFEGKSSFSAD